ncbi:MAG: hypothetical protein DRQ78_01565 [Epsilonproteobacteria bacterium]|nr:MAG: hypothetical protein DRQ78_01565 [Campylobacterota bacterium]
MKIQLLTATLLLFLLGACGNTPNLDYANEYLSLQLGKEPLRIHGKEQKKYKENFSTLFLTQRLLRLDDGSLLMYEYAQTDMQYQFDPITTRSIEIIFDTRSIKRIYEKDFLFAYQLVLSDNRILNIIVSQGFDQELIMLYGMSTNKLNQILRTLDPDATQASYHNVINLKNENNPLLSKWTTIKVHLAPLVVPLRIFGRF